MPEYFTLPELRALPDMDDTAVYTDARVEAAAAYVVAVIEREVDTSFVARTVTETVSGGGSGVVLSRPYVLSVTSATENGVAVTDALTAADGVLRRTPAGSHAPAVWASGYDNIEVTYQAGYSATPPADIKEAALQATRYRLLSTDGDSGISDRATSITNEYGNVNLSTAGVDRPTGLPEVDAVILGWKQRLDNFGFC